MNSKISIIVPIYNTEKYLCRCLDSIITQSYSNIEIILVDDGSKDSSPSICDEYAQKDKRIIVVHKENGGLSSARNAGLAVATGEYIGFVDSDDYVSKDMYKILAENIPSDECAISNVMCVRSDESGKTWPSSVPHTSDKTISSLDFVKELMLHIGDVSVCTKLFPKQIFNNIKFREGSLNEDLLFMLDVLAEINTVYFVGCVGYYYFVRSESISSGYGKAVIDMVGNSLKVKELLDESYPELNKYTSRFTLYQHMAYLLLVPEGDANKNNKVYVDAIRYIRKHTLSNLNNPYLKTKNKITLISLMVMPKITAKMYQKKRGI